MIGNKFHFNTPFIIPTKIFFSPDNSPSGLPAEASAQAGGFSGGIKVNFKQTLFNIDFAGFQEKNCLTA
jgi:hypothetical protein